MNWPERPACHDKDISPVFKFGAPTWRDLETGRADGSSPRPFRSCSYCGSIHPEDLMAALDKGARMGGSDWKYGWPHKFYVYDIPNPNEGKLVQMGSISCGGDFKTGEPRQPTEDERKRYTGWEQDGRGFWSGKLIEPDKATTHGKWYNVHLLDLLPFPETFAAFAALLEKSAGIKWEIEGQDLKYKAPYRGYQRV